ncbi:hypothetical protein FJY69_08555 [candidate division WOR-3 bacterium]|nr:hypothetical protein [candidate division WOR-3 bacterium]
MKRSRQAPGDTVKAEDKKRLERARADLQKMQETLAPFIKKRVIQEHSTAGEWCETSQLCPP